MDTGTLIVPAHTYAQQLLTQWYATLAICNIWCRWAGSHLLCLLLHSGLCVGETARQTEKGTSGFLPLLTLVLPWHAGWAVF